MIELIQTWVIGKETYVIFSTHISNYLHVYYVKKNTLLCKLQNAVKAYSKILTHGATHPRLCLRSLSGIYSEFICKMKTNELTTLASETCCIKKWLSQCDHWLTLFYMRSCGIYWLHHTGTKDYYYTGWTMIQLHLSTSTAQTLVPAWCLFPTWQHRLSEIF